MEYYGSMESLLEAYGDFISRISPDGIFFYNGEDRSLVSLADRTKARRSDFGIDGHFKVTCSNYVCRKSIEFDLVVQGRICGRVKSPLIGRHNLMNILAAVSVCLELGMDFKDIAAAVETFRGVGRRFDKIGKIGTIEVVEDYAHHPTELLAVIRAAKNYGEGRVISIFQPHRYSRTNDLADDFVRCFYDSDVLILTDVYSADEEPVEGVEIRDIYDRIDRNRFEMLDFVKKEEIPDLVSRIVRDKDLVLVLGAGDIREISAPLIEMIEKRQSYG
jgi:UDP-N-acetylmuramate--alanine ligase